MTKLISPTSLSRFMSCPAKYRYMQDKSLPTITVDTAGLERGRTFHELFIIQYWQNIPDAPTELEIQQVAEMIFQRSYGSEPTDDEKALLRHFIKFEQTRLNTSPTYKPELIEATFYTDTYTCRIDFFSNKTIYDWKTSKTDRLDDDMLRQGTINTLALKSNGIDVQRMVFVLLWSGKTIELPYIPEVWVENQVFELRNAERLDSYPDKRSKLCKYCPYLLRCYGKERSLWD